MAWKQPPTPLTPPRDRGRLDRELERAVGVDGYPELATSSPSPIAWAAAAGRSLAEAERRRDDAADAYARALRRRNRAVAVTYGAILAGAVIIADLGGAPGLF